jgi:hypothetical protein
VSRDQLLARQARLRADRAIGQAYARLPHHSRERATFTRLLQHVRERASPILRSPIVHGRHAGVEALLNLSRFVHAHVRPMAGWRGADASWQRGVHSLAQHLLGRYGIPAFLGAAWYAADDPYAEAKRRWFVAHGDGVRFRSLDLPMRMTRTMEHVFLKSDDHVGIEQAMRRAELIALGAERPLVDAVLATRVGADLANSDFWRTAWIFLIANTQEIGLAQVGPIIDFLDSLRHQRVALEDRVILDPPQPAFSLKGRTARSLLRLMEEWHRGLGFVTGGISWQRSRLRPLVLEVPRQDPEPDAPPLFWELTELTTSEQLRAEGAALKHCVASYSYKCQRGISRIWSLRSRRGPSVRPIVTIEVDLARRAIIQARGFRNNWPAGRALDVIQRWAAQEGLRLTM